MSAVISERVLSRLVSTPGKNLTELTGAYLDGVSSAALPHQGPFISVDEAVGLSRFRRDLNYQDRRVGTIVGEVRIDALIAERRNVMMTLVFTNAALTLLLATVGYIVIRRMVKPVALLTDHMSIGPGAEFLPIP